MLLFSVLYNKKNILCRIIINLLEEFNIKCAADDAHKLGFHFPMNERLRARVFSLS